MRVLSTRDPAWPGFLADLRGRAGADLAEAEATVRPILAAVRAEGDAALFRYARRFDGTALDGESVRVPPEELRRAAEQMPGEARAALRLAAERIEAFHRRHAPRPWLWDEDGAVLGQVWRPLRRVGLYIPGGRAAYPSTVLMTAIPARVAGVPEVVLCSPAGPDGRLQPGLLAAADLAGVQAVYRVGGAHAVAAMAYGTASLPAVDKIVGPGNIYVTAAKRLLYGLVGIDMLAGPTEILILADGTARPGWVAADLLSQAEHDPRSAAILLTPSAALAAAVAREVERQTAARARRGVIEACLARYGALVVVRDLAEGVEVANAIGPEHLEVLAEDAWALLAGLTNAGAIFLGHETPEAAGDYVAGPSHVLPTGGSARFQSGLGVEDFMKRSSLIRLTPGKLRQVAGAVGTLAGLEGLEAHGQAVAVRLPGGEAE
jgi:histidinol dehydrogenase